VYCRPPAARWCRTLDAIGGAGQRSASSPPAGNRYMVIAGNGGPACGMPGFPAGDAVKLANMGHTCNYRGDVGDLPSAPAGGGRGFWSTKRRRGAKGAKGTKSSTDSGAGKGRWSTSLDMMERPATRRR
jgi:hypothetical protein